MRLPTLIIAFLSLRISILNSRLTSKFLIIRNSTLIVVYITTLPLFISRKYKGNFIYKKYLYSVSLIP
jgi:hypothetical protein